MATRFIHKGIDPDKSPYSNVAPFCVDDEGKLVVVRGPEFKGALSADPQAESIPVSRVIAATASLTLTPADSGAMVMADTTGASVVVTLPPTQKGLRYTVVTKQLPGSGAGTTVTPNAADKFIYSTKVDGATLINSAASDVVGDCLTIIGDGVDGWVVIAIRGTWA